MDCQVALPHTRKQNAIKIIVSTVMISVLFLLSVSACLAQDYQSITAVKFKDGSVVRGKIIEMNPTTIRILKPDGNIETRNYQDVASFIEGPYTGEQPATRPPAAPPPNVPPPYAAPPPPYAVPPPYAMPPPPAPVQRARATYSRAPENYFALKVGVYSPFSDELDNFDSGFTGEIAFGHYFHPNFALELGVGYFEIESDHRNDYNYYYYRGYHDEDRIWVVPITLSLKPAFQFPPFELYGLVGGGLYIIDVETREYSTRTGTFSFSDSASVFGAHVGGGLTWNVSPRVGVGLELKYIWAEKKFEKTVNGTKFEVDADLQGLQTTLNLSFRF